MKRVQQQFWKNHTDYQVLNGRSVLVENLTLKEVLKYCIENSMLRSISFMIGEDEGVKETYKNILTELNII